MHQGIPNLSALRAFEAAARLGSFAQAAQELALTPPAISRSIARLEEELGYALFHRSHRAVSLTEEGARYAQRATEAFRQLAQRPLGEETKRPTINLDVEATFLRQWLLPRLRHGSFDDLNVTLNIRSHNDPPRVIAASADLAIVWGFADYSGFKRTRLVSPNTIIVAAPHLRISSMSESGNHCLIHEGSDHWWRLVFQEAGMPYPEHGSTLTLSRCDIPIEAARLGLGVAVADDVIAEQELKSGALIPVDGPRFDGQDYYMMSRKTASVPVRNFAAWVLAEATTFAEWQLGLTK